MATETITSYYFIDEKATGSDGQFMEGENIFEQHYWVTSACIREFGARLNLWIPNAATERHYTKLYSLSLNLQVF